MLGNGAGRRRPVPAAERGRGLAGAMKSRDSDPDSAWDRVRKLKRGTGDLPRWLYGAVGSWMARAAAEAVLGTGNTPACMAGAPRIRHKRGHLAQKGTAGLGVLTEARNRARRPCRGGDVKVRQRGRRCARGQGAVGLLRVR